MWLTQPQPAASPVPVLPRVGRLSQIRQLGHSFAMCLFLSSLTSAVTKLGSCKLGNKPVSGAVGYARMLTLGVFFSRAEPQGPILPSTQAPLPGAHWKSGASQGLPVQLQLF